MYAPTITPLQKHRGQNGAVVALFLLLAAVAVVMTTQPKRNAPPDEPPAPPRKLAVAAPAAATPAPPVTVASAPRTGPITEPAEIILDEAKTGRVFAPVPGWLAKVPARAMGRRVRAGETLATLHSVDVYLAELDLVAQVQQFTTQEQLDVARRRLLRWYMRPEAVRRIETTGVAGAELPLIAPKDGIVVAMTALPGLYTTPAELYTITDPNHVWVMAGLDEADASRLVVGTPATLKVHGFARPFATKVAYIYRRVEDGKRKVRFEVAARIKPGTAATVTLAP